MIERIWKTYMYDFDWSRGRYGCVCLTEILPMPCWKKKKTREWSNYFRTLKSGCHKPPDRKTTIYWCQIVSRLPHSLLKRYGVMIAPPANNWRFETLTLGNTDISLPRGRCSCHILLCSLKCMSNLFRPWLNFLTVSQVLHLIFLTY